MELCRADPQSAKDRKLKTSDFAQKNARHEPGSGKFLQKNGQHFPQEEKTAFQNQAFCQILAFSVFQGDSNPKGGEDPDKKPKKSLEEQKIQKRDLGLSRVNASDMTQKQTVTAEKLRGDTF